MGKYPVLEINRKVIKRNIEIIKTFCEKNGIIPAAVIKGFNAIDVIVDEIVKAEYPIIASSRIPHLKKVKEKYPFVKTLALRIPMISEIEDIIKYCDISLNSELQTLKLLNDEAKKQGIIHSVILMRDLGDLREGIFDGNELIELACFVEKNLSNLYLYGIGTNLTCYGSVLPTYKNLSELSMNAEEIEKRIGRKLDIVSGGGTSSIPLLVKGNMPKGINNLRIGEALMLTSELETSYNCKIEGLSNDTLILKAEIIEINEKPTHPIGELGVNCFGNCPTYVDRGIRKRAILAMGAFDYGNWEKLIPRDKGIEILGASSDHTIIDIQDSEKNYKLGDIIEFTLRYQAMLFTTSNNLITKVVI